ncbi:MAG: AI-2E family transporter [Propionicimonas sp.]|uniref:AI-2E family transporter n=1 Tax=Propionicimonas sp. TaxID=1955623 RepID=UPI002B1F54D4|nr:AI-2E family transporter [Propionicimonas sp.]MEA4943167.1 AI-2E family transporter [Propionicimonas sp.]MEA5052045.1 AI-2E family transporter [Propionicimonas sp.]MEA5116723.1 AI-2E family transporter [Propionicimonas sp.]
MTQPPHDPTPPVPTPVSPPRAPLAGSAPTPSSEPATKNWLLRWRRVTQPTPPDLSEGASPVSSGRVSLLNRNPFTIGFFLAAGAFTAYALLTSLGRLSNVIVLILLSLILALGLNPVVEWIHNRGIRRGLAVLVVALALLILLALALWAIVPVVSEQVTNLYNDAPTYLRDLRENPQIAAFDEQFQVINRIISFLTSGELISGLFGGIIGAGQIVATTAFSITITVVLTLYFLISLPSIKEVIYQLAPASRRPRVKYLATEVFKRVGGYVSGLFVVVSLWTIVSLLLFTFTGLNRFAVALAVVVGICAFIPLVGTTIGIVISGIVALSISPITCLIVVLVLLAYQQFDAYFVQPRIFSRSVQVPGVLVILAATSGGLLLGLVGAILAIPITAALLLLYREVLVPHLNRL